MSWDIVHVGLGLVVAAGIEFEVAEWFAVGGGDADVEVFDEDRDWSMAVTSADADVVESAAVAQGELAGGVDGVVAYSVVGVVEADPWGGAFGRAS